MRKALTVSAVLLTLTPLLTSCGTQKTDDSGSTATSTTSAPTSPTTSAPSSAASVPAASSLVVSPGTIGNARIGQDRTEAMNTGYFDANVTDSGTGCTWPLKFKAPLSDALDVAASDSGTITSMWVTGAGPKTADGLGVGSTLAEVSEKFESAEMYDAGQGNEQTGLFVSDGDSWLGFLFDAPLSSVKRSDTVKLMEVSTGDKPSLINDGC